MKKSAMGIILTGILGVVFYLAVGGCTWLTFSGREIPWQKDPVFKGVVSHRVYLNSIKCKAKNDAACESLTKALKVQINKSHQLVTEKSAADVVMDVTAKFYKVTEGKIYFFLGIIPNDGFDGGLHTTGVLQVSAVYRQDRRVERRVGRFYGPDNDVAASASQMIIGVITASPQVLDDGTNRTSFTF